MVKKSQKGFTVIEVLIGIAVFAIIMPSIIIAVVGVGRLNNRAALLTRANIVAENKIESLRSAGYNSLDEETVVFTDELDSAFPEPRTASYTVTSTVTGVKEITVNIQYKDQGRDRSLAFKSLMSELGVAQ